MMGVVDSRTALTDLVQSPKLTSNLYVWYTARYVTKSLFINVTHHAVCQV